MEINKQTITVDFKQNTVAPIPHYTQFDSNTVEFVVKDAGIAADLSGVNEITMNYKRPDGVVTSRILSAVGNIITYEIGNEEMSVAGYGEMVLQFYFNDSRISTKRIKIYFGESLGTAFENGAGYPLVQELFTEVAETVERVTDAGNYAMEKGGEAYTAAESVKINWLTPVATFNDIATTYPDPQHGDTVHVTDITKVYRFETGIGWMNTHEYNSSTIDYLVGEVEEVEADLQIIIGNDGEPKFTPFDITSDTTIVLDSNAKSGKLNVGVRGNTANKKSLKNVEVKVKSPDNLEESKLSLKWKVGEGRSTNGVFDSILGGGYEDLTSWNTRPRAIITFDDGWSSQHDLAYNYMKTKGIKGTIYTVPTFVDQTGYVTKAQLDAMYADGWCIANHTYTHPNMGAYTYAQAYSEIEQTKNWLQTNGYTSGLRHIAFPNGASNADVKQACRDLGLTTARDIGNSLASNFSLTDTLQSLVPITCGLGTGAASDFAAVKTQIDNAIAQNKVCIMMFHRIFNVAGEGGSSTTDGMNFVYDDLVQVMDYLVSVGMATETIDEFYNKLDAEIQDYNIGKQSIEFNGGYQEFQRTGKIVLDGSLDWGEPILFNENMSRIHLDGFSTAYPDVSNAIDSNHTSFNNVFDFVKDVYINPDNPSNNQMVVHANGTLYISIDRTYAEANNLYTIAAYKTWLNANPITFIYERITPITIPSNVTITTNGEPDTSLRSFGEGSVITVSVDGDSAPPVIVESHPIREYNAIEDVESEINEVAVQNVSKTGDTMWGTLEVPSVKTGTHTLEHHQIEGEDTELVTIRRDGENYTILEVVAPDRVVNGHREATLTLMREVDPDTGSPDFVDLYNMNYIDGKQMGIRVQTRGVGGILRDFVFDFNNGSGVIEAMRVKPDKDIIYRGNARYQSANDQIIEFQDANGDRVGYFGRIVSTATDKISLFNSVGGNNVELHDNGSTVFYSPTGDFYVYLDTGAMFVNDSKVQTQDLTTLRSPDGSVWKASIDDTGVVSWIKQV